jgi:flagellar basal body-associated protein FliL
MSDKGQEKKSEAAAPAPEAKDAGAKKGGLPVKTIGLILGLLVVEGVGIMGLMSVMGKPSEVKATEMHEDHDSAGEKLVELPVLSERFTNNSSGRLFVWDMEILIKCKTKHAGDVSVLSKDAKAKPKGGHGEEGGGAAHEPATGVAEELKARIAEIRTGIGTIVSSAQHPYFTEPGRETLTRQILEYLREAFKQDPQGEERVQSVLIPKCLGFPSDFGGG